jgi:hypothetical protein
MCPALLNDSNKSRDSKDQKGIRMTSEQVETNDRRNRREGQDSITQEALARGASYREAAEAAGVSIRTVERRMADGTFAAEVATLRAERVGTVLAELVELSVESTTILRRSLKDLQPGIRLRAVSLVLTHMAKLRRDHDLEARLAALEARLDSDTTGSDLNGEEGS